MLDSVYAPVVSDGILHFYVGFVVFQGCSLNFALFLVATDAVAGCFTECDISPSHDTGSEVRRKRATVARRLAVLSPSAGVNVRRSPGRDSSRALLEQAFDEGKNRHPFLAFFRLV